jgi:hypothetical protein
MRVLAILVAVGVLGGPAAAGTESGAEIAVHTGFTLPVGNIDASGSFSDAISGFIPIGAELGYRLNPSVYLGLFGEYGLGITKNCPSTLDCSAHTISIGLEGRYRFSHMSQLGPWVGFGVGYEWLNLSAIFNGATASSTANGLQFGRVSGGFDFAVTPAFTVGPYIAASLGEYLSEDSAGPGADKALHGFLQVGVRIAFLP